MVLSTSVLCFFVFDFIMYFRIILNNSVSFYLIDTQFFQIFNQKIKQKVKKNIDKKISIRYVIATNQSTGDSDEEYYSIHITAICSIILFWSFCRTYHYSRQKDHRPGDDTNFGQRVYDGHQYFPVKMSGQYCYNRSFIRLYL